jgi:hypothetical protein
MKSKLFDWVCLFYNITKQDFFENYYTRDKKEIKSKTFNGLSPREAMIHVSEDVIKPLLGQDYLGVYTANNLDVDKINIISDAGFIKEVKAVEDKVGFNNCIIIKIKREGYDFSSDSRSELPDKFLDIPTYTIDNNKNAIDMLYSVDKILENLSEDFILS